MVRKSRTARTAVFERQLCYDDGAQLGDEKIRSARDWPAWLASTALRLLRSPLQSAVDWPRQIQALLRLRPELGGYGKGLAEEARTGDFQFDQRSRRVRLRAL